MLSQTRSTKFFLTQLFFPIGNTILHDFHYVSPSVKLAPFCAMFLGVLLAIYFYLIDPTAPIKPTQQQYILYQFLLNKWYFDEL